MWCTSPTPRVSGWLCSQHNSVQGAWIGLYRTHGGRPCERTHACANAHALVHPHTHTRTHIYIYINTFTFTTCMCANNTHIHSHTHTHTHTHTHIHTHMRTHSHFCILCLQCKPPSQPTPTSSVDHHKQKVSAHAGGMHD